MKRDSSALEHVRGEVTEVLAGFLDEQQKALADVDHELLPCIAAIADFITGGKRLRPAFCYWGWRGAGGEDCLEIMVAAAALELLHASALIHDDVMDASDIRRGRPALHRQFEARHVMAGWRGSPAAFGLSTAILLGDLLLCWTDEMLCGSGLPHSQLSSGRKVLGKMRTEMMAGQYLDLVGQAAGDGTVRSALRVAEYKSARYTVERPLQLGAALASAEMSGNERGCAIAAAYTAYGLPLGVAFQIRDDILGVFGDPAQTGKPAGDDLREGKRTVLLAVARSRATARQAAVIDRYLGDQQVDQPEMADVQAVITDTGALAACEEMIDHRVSQALASLASAPVTPQAKQALTELAAIAAIRHD